MDENPSGCPWCEERQERIEELETAQLKRVMDRVMPQVHADLDLMNENAALRAKLAEVEKVLREALQRMQKMRPKCSLEPEECPDCAYFALFVLRINTLLKEAGAERDEEIASLRAKLAESV